VVLHPEHNVEVAGRTSVVARVAFPGDAQPRAIVHTGRNLDLNGALAAHASLALALRTGIANHLPHPAALRTGAGDGEKPLLVADLAASVAGRAGRRAGTLAGAAAAAFCASLPPWDLDPGFGSPGGALKAQLEVVAQVAPSPRAGARAPAGAAEQLFDAEEVAENVGEIGEDGLVKPGEGLAAHAGVSVAVVGGALLRVDEHAVGFGQFLEALLRLFLAVGIAIRVPLQGGAAVGLFEFLVGGVAGHAQDFVVVPLLVD